jgi:Mn-containing catalase
LPSGDEWYKAAYYDPVAVPLRQYPTGSNEIPDGFDFIGDPNFDAVYPEINQNNVELAGPSDITNVGKLSPYGTAGQGGNAGGPLVTDSVGVPWTGAFVNSNGDLTVDLRSNIGAETRAQIVYERLLQFTDDPCVQDSLRFLMTLEIAHFQQFSAALATIEPNFPPGVMQGDLRFTHTYFNMSPSEDARGPWNKGKGPWAAGERWEYVEDAVAQVEETKGQTDKTIEGHERDEKSVRKIESELAKQRSAEVATPDNGEFAWSTYAEVLGG